MSCLVSATGYWRRASLQSDAEITIKPDDKIMLSRNPEENILVIYVDEIKLNKIISSVKYNRNEYGDNQDSDCIKQHNIDVYALFSRDGYVNIRNSPNGKIIKKINHNFSYSEDYIVYYYKGLYNFKELEGTYYSINIASQLENNAEKYYNQINKLLNMKNLKIGNWYKVVYFSVKIMAYGLGDDTMLELSVQFRNQCSCKLNKNHSCEIA